MTIEEKADAISRILIAHKAWTRGDRAFATEVLAAAWDHTNRADIKAIYDFLMASKNPTTEEHWLARNILAEID